LANRNTIANGEVIIFKVDMTGKIGLKVSYSTRNTSTGFNSQAWSFSTDDTNWTTANTFTDMSTTYATETLTADMSALNGVSTAYLRLVVNGASSTSGNNRLDNIQ